MTPTTTAEATGFAAAVRAATTRDHSDTESAGFMTALMKGALDAAAVAALAARLLPVYQALEAQGRRLSDDALAGPFVDPALERSAALAADLSALGTPALDVSASPAASAYIARLEAVGSSPAAFIAHHYTRYLGDLSGGQAIGAVLRRQYGLAEGGASFYSFDQIDDSVAYKRRYRERLDGLPAMGIDERAFIDEVKIAYELNGGLFAELDDVYAATVR